MAKDNKTLLDGLLAAETGVNEESLEEILGMNEGIKTDDLAFLVQQAENGNEDAIYAVGISYMYAENGFPQDELEGVFWLSQSTNKEAPRHVAGYYLKQGDFENMKEWALKAHSLGSLNAYDLYRDLFKQFCTDDGEILAQAEQFLSVLFGLEKTKEQEESVYRLVVALINEYLKIENYKKGLEWALVIQGHLDPVHTETILEGIYSIIMLDDVGCDEHIAAAVDYMKKRAEKKDGEDAIKNLALYYMEHPVDESTVQYWVEKAAALGLTEAKNWLAEQEKLYNAPKKVLKKADAEKLLTDLAARGRTTLEIPREYTEIAKGAFSYIGTPYMMKIRKIILPETIRVIGNEAFEGSSSLTSINIPKRLETLGKYALKGCILKGFFMKTVKSENVIENLTIPGQTKLSSEAFGDISGIGCLKFVEGRKELNWMVFYSLYQETKIQEVHLPASLVKITNPDTPTSGLYIEKLYAPKRLQSDINGIKRGDKFTNIKEVIYF